jgi:hypothetical protein
MSGSSTRRNGAVVLAATGALALTLVSAGGAQARPVTRPARADTSNCKINGYGPNELVLGAAPVKKTFSVDVSGCTLTYWLVGVRVFVEADKKGQAGFADVTKPTITLSPKGLKNSAAGVGDAVVLASGSEDADATDPNVLETKFTLLRRASWGTTVNASPEPAVVDKKITVTGVLRRVSWNGKKKAGYVGYAGRAVRVQFQKDGETTWTTITTVKTGKKGQVKAVVKAVDSGTWRLHYGGNGTTGKADSAGDAVPVLQ